MAGIALCQLFAEELPLAALDNIGPETGTGFLVELAVAPDEPAFEQRSADGQILARHADSVIYSAARVPHFQAQVPQVIEHCLNHLLAPRRTPGRCDKGDIDV